MRVKRFAAPPYMTNTYCAYDDQTKQAVLIDPTGSAQVIRRWLEAEGLAVLGGLFTHGHVDHFPKEEEAWFREFPWYAHEKAIEAFQNPAVNLSESIYGQGITYTEILPVVGNGIMRIGPFAFTVIETPGHTAGSVCYLMGKGLFSGDTLFKESVGRTDLPTGSMDLLRKSLKRLMAELSDEIQVFPGHGDPTTIGHERQTNPYIEETL